MNVFFVEYFTDYRYDFLGCSYDNDSSGNVVGSLVFNNVNCIGV